MDELQAINLSLGKIANQLKGASTVEQTKIAEEVATNAQVKAAVRDGLIAWDDILVQFCDCGEPDGTLYGGDGPAAHKNRYQRYRH